MHELCPKCGENTIWTNLQQERRRSLVVVLYYLDRWRAWLVRGEPASLRCANGILSDYEDLMGRLGCLRPQSQEHFDPVTVTLPKINPLNYFRDQLSG